MVICSQRLSNPLIVKGPDDGYSRSVSCAIKSDIYVIIPLNKHMIWPNSHKTLKCELCTHTQRSSNQNTVNVGYCVYDRKSPSIFVFVLVIEKHLVHFQTSE